MKKTLRSFNAGGVSLVEAKNREGSEWEVVIIEAGPSANGTFYPSEVLRRATPLFDGVRALARADEEHTRDLNRSVKNIVGWFSLPRFDGRRIVARFHVSGAAEWLRRLLLDAWRRGKKDLTGFSIVARGDAVARREEGRSVTYVESIERVFTVDVVLNPAAGGRFLKLVAGLSMTADTLTKEEKRMYKLLELVREKAPDLYERIDPDKVSEDELLSLLRQALEGREKKSLVSEAVNLVRESRESLRLMECQALLREKLAEAGLPRLTAARLEKRFFGKIFEEVELTEAIAEERSYLAKLSESGRVSGLGAQVRVGEGEAQKLRHALDGFFADRDLNGTPRFRSFREAYVKITGDANLTGQLREARNIRRLTESLTSDSWAEILGDSITRRMLAEYAMPGLQDWRKIVSDITAPRDFRTNRRLRVGGYGDLPAVAENGDYQTLTSPGDEESTYLISKKGGLEELTLEMIANDDVGAIRRIPVRLARAAANTLYRTVFDLLKDNGNIYDGLSLFHADHGNLGSDALDSTSLLNAKIAMGKQTAYGAATEVLGLVPRYLVVPLDIQDIAYRVTTSGTLVGAANNAATEPNLHSSYGLEVIQSPYWTDSNDWVLVCEPRDCPTIEVGFFNGQEEPELFVQDQPDVGSMFSADKITYKIRHVYGVCALDYRGLYKSVVV